MKAVLIPIDNRPVTYSFPQILARLAGVQALCPPRGLMGSLQAHTNVDAVGDWLAETIQRQQPDALLVCMDTIIYGGLIPSRRVEIDAKQLLDKTKVVSRWKKWQPRMSILAQSSVMRISDNYDNTEEKVYWSRYGREIYAWSEAMHRMSSTAGGGTEPTSKLRPGELSQLESRIPSDIRKDYLDTRWRNFQVNRKMLDFAESGEIDFLIFSQDDSGEFGLNVLEKERLLGEAQRRNLKNVISYAGADEVLMTMLARWLTAGVSQRPRAQVVFSPSEGANIASRYEGQTIGQSVQSQVRAAGFDDGSQNADMLVIVHTSGDRQGDHIWLPGHSDLRFVNSANAVTSTLELLEQATLPVVLCDVAYANGADPLLVDQLLTRPELLGKICGYAGWNTTGNSLGCALAMGAAFWFATRNQPADEVRSDPALKEALFIRLADDWAYQTQARKQLGNQLSLEQLRDLMMPHLQRIQIALDFKPRQVRLELPWQRSFEVEIQLQSELQPTR